MSMCLVMSKSNDPVVPIYNIQREPVAVLCRPGTQIEHQQLLLFATPDGAQHPFVRWLGRSSTKRHPAQDESEKPFRNIRNQLELDGILMNPCHMEILLEINSDTKRSPGRLASPPLAARSATRRRSWRNCTSWGLAVALHILVGVIDYIPKQNRKKLKWETWERVQLSCESIDQNWTQGWKIR